MPSLGPSHAPIGVMQTPGPCRQRPPSFCSDSDRLKDASHAHVRKISKKLPRLLARPKTCGMLSVSCLSLLLWPGCGRNKPVTGFTSNRWDAANSPVRKNRVFAWHPSSPHKTGRRISKRSFGVLSVHASRAPHLAATSGGARVLLRERTPALAQSSHQGVAHCMTLDRARGCRRCDRLTETAVTFGDWLRRRRGRNGSWATDVLHPRRGSAARLKNSMASSRKLFGILTPWVYHQILHGPTSRNPL